MYGNLYDALKAARPAMAAKDHAFADSLLQGYLRGWSAKQAHWAGVLADRVNNPPAPPEQVVSDLQPILDAFAQARKHLKAPGFRILLGASSALRITVASARSRTPGDLFLAGDGAWGERSYYGRLDTERRFHPGRDANGREAEIKGALARFAADPVAAAKSYARLLGKCCFCNLPLTDERSTAIGYGQKCSQNYGLPWGSSAARLEAA